MKTTKRAIALALVLTLMSLSAQAVVYLGAPFQSGMVLQQQTDVNLWGHAARGSVVTISPSWTDEATTCIVDADGRWHTTLATPAASFEKQRIVFSDGGAKTTTLSNVLIGEVWISSGQSNMEMPVRGWASSPIHNVDSIVASAANYTDKLRYVNVRASGHRYPQDSTGIKWTACSKTEVANFSVVAYFFATHLIDSLNVPVGIINASYGGSCVEAWIPVEANRAFGSIKMNDETYANITQNTPSANYNAMIHPLRGLTTRGFIWYQGENNVYTLPTEYAYHLSTMIESWRKAWGQGDLPFYIVELTPYSYNNIEGTNAALTREHQNLVQHMLPAVRLVGTNDLILPTETEQIHPSHKLGVGQRLGNHALHDLYGFGHLRPANPELKSVHFQDGKAYLRFTETADGFNLSEGITGFEISANGTAFYKATAVVENGEVIVQNASVTKPTAVRYCYRNFLLGNLKNSVGLPLLPFRTDGSLVTYVPQAAYVGGERLAFDQFQAGDTILLAGASCVEANGHFFNGTGMQRGATDDCAFVLEAAPDVVQTGQKAFYLKHLLTDRYVTARNIDNSSATSGTAPYLATADEAAAFCFAEVKDTIQTTTSRTPGWDDLSVCVVHQGFDEKGYFGRFLSHQWDTEQALVTGVRYLCAWNAYRAVRVDGAARTDLARTLAHARLLADRYVAGTNPGYTEPVALAAFQRLTKDAETLLNRGATANEVADLNLQLADALSNLEAQSVPVTEGYYTIVSAYPGFRSVQGKEKMLYGTADGKLQWNNVNNTDKSGIFRFEASDNGQWTLQCVGTQQYVGISPADAGIALSETASPLLLMPFLKGQWEIVWPAKPSQDFYADGYGNGSVASGRVALHAADVAASPSAWYLRRVTDQERIEELEAYALTFRIRELLQQCRALNDVSPVGSSIGDVDAEVKAAFEQAIADAETYEGLTKAELDDLCTQLATALQTFDVARRTFEVGRWYYVVNQDTTEASPFRQAGLCSMTYNTTEAFRWSATDDIAGWYGVDFDEDYTAYRHDPTTMWRLLPVDGVEGAYALQNRATGAFLGPTTTAGRHGLGRTPSPWTVTLLGHEQVALTSLDDQNPDRLELSAVENLQAVVNAEGGNSSAAAWNLVPVDEAADLEYLEVVVPGNVIAIACMPFAVSGLHVDDGTVETYTIKDIPQARTISLTRKDAFAAGEPFFIRTTSPFSHLAFLCYDVPADDTYATSPLTVNGLTGTFDKTQVTLPGALYFLTTNYQLREASRVGFVVNSQSGYVDPSAVSDTGASVDLVIGEGADGVYTVKQAKEAVDVYSADGRKVRSHVQATDATKYLPRGVYLIDGRKVRVK